MLTSSSTRNPAIVVTGAAGRLGQLVVRRLHRVAPVVAIDRRRGTHLPTDVVHLRLDLRSNRCEDVFRARPILAVVHLGIMHDPRRSSRDHHSFNVVGTQRLLEYCQRYEVPKLVYLSSADVYGPAPDNPHFLREDAPLMGAAPFQEIRDLVTVDMAIQSFFWKVPEVETVILRPVHILGRVRNAPSNYLRQRRIVRLAGFDPQVQIIHEEDVVTAIARALRPGIRGVFNVAGPPPVPLSVVLRLAGKPVVPLPASVFGAGLRMLWRLRATTFPPAELNHIRYLCTVDDTAARTTLGFAPAFTVRDAVDAALGRRIFAPPPSEAVPRYVGVVSAVLGTRASHAVTS